MDWAAKAADIFIMGLYGAAEAAPLQGQTNPKKPRSFKSKTENGNRRGGEFAKLRAACYEIRTEGLMGKKSTFPE
jgi:hypothetical protein